MVETLIRGDDGENNPDEFAEDVRREIAAIIAGNESGGLDFLDVGGVPGVSMRNRDILYGGLRGLGPGVSSGFIAVRGAITPPILN